MSRVYACLGVTYHLHFWKNGRGLLRDTAATRGWNRHRIRSQHTKLTLEKKILPPPLPGFELATFRSRVRCYTNKLSRIVLSVNLFLIVTGKKSDLQTTLFCYRISLHCTRIHGKVHFPFTIKKTRFENTTKKTIDQKCLRLGGVSHIPDYIEHETF